MSFENPYILPIVGCPPKRADRQKLNIPKSLSVMIKIENITIQLPKWKWWQLTILIVLIILALKIDPNKAFELIKIIVGWIKGS